MSGLVLAVGLAVAAPPLAAAEEPAAAVAPLPESVTADALPTVQIDGVAWKQAIAGNIVYVGGSFANARPAGAAPGTNLTPRGNMLAYDITTGALVTSFAPVFNDQVKDLSVSPDGKRLYAVGPFTQVNGQTRNRVAVFDLPSGNLSSFAPSVNSVVQSVASTNTTLYIGGYFGSVNGLYRPRIAAINTQTGAVQPFSPPVDDRQVQAIVVAPDEQSIVIAGNFTSIGGSSSPGYGLARIATPSGALMPLPVNTEARNGGDQAGFLSLSSDGTSFYGSGWVYGSGGNIEGSFAANWSDGALKWVEDCHGDTYGVYAGVGAVYSASHKHYCGNSGGFPQTNPWSFYHSTAVTSDARGVNTPDIYGYPHHAGTPRPQFLNWYPQTDVGTYTGKSQATWSVTGNSQYVVYGGEFPKVNGTPQQGLVRYAVRSIAPKKQGPRLQTIYWNPSVKSFSNGSVRISFTTNWDRDDSSLTYRVYRAAENTTPLLTETIDTPFWLPQNRSVTDTGLTPGSTQRYRVTATDRDGNIGRSDWINVTVSNAPVSPYVQSVLDDGAKNFWRLGEASGATAFDWAGADDQTLTGGYTRNVAGAMPDDTATRFNGTNAFGAPAAAIAGPDVFTAEAWFRTTSTKGGKILSFGDRRTGNSGNYDRHLYMDGQGRVFFGVYNNASYTVNTSTGLNNGQWHHAVGTLGPNGIALYVDGKKIGTNTGTSMAQPYSGYWRIGGDSTWAGSPYFTGDIDDAAIYPTVLTTTQVQDHYVASGRTAAIPAKPTDPYGIAVYDSEPSAYWRLGETSGTTASDTSPETSDGTYFGNRTTNVTGAVAGTTNKAVTFNGSNGGMASVRSWVNPTRYSLQLWFRTTTNRGGKLIGFGDLRSGLSTSYDRHVYMLDDGRLRFGTYTGQENLADSTRSYNDGAWHQMVATQGTDGMGLYVDGVLVGSNPQTSALAYTGYWRVGGDTTWGGATSAYFGGSIDEVAVFDRAISASDVRAMYLAGGGTVANQDPIASFDLTTDGLDLAVDGSASADPDGSIVSHSWTFGDGGSATGPTATHRYAASGTYEVRLTVTDNRGATRTKAVSVTVVNHLPSASFTADVSNLDVALDASASTDDDGTLTGYSWDLGDGRTVTGKTVTVSYPTAGTRTIVLTVTDSAGGTATASRQVSPSAANVAPTASFTHAANGLNVSFDGTASTDGDGSIASWSWNFGDGSTGSGAEVDHAYQAGGTFMASLTVTDNRGATATSSHEVEVVAPNRAPTARFTTTRDGLVASFDATGSTDPDGDALSYSWDLGNGSVSTSATPSVSYSEPGTYTVTLTVNDGRGGQDIETEQVAVDYPVFGRDAFTRAVTSGWGTADVGGAWSLSGALRQYTVSDNSGRFILEGAGYTTKALLNGVSRRDVELRASVTLNKIGDGGGTFVSLAARSGGFSSAYLGKVWVKSNGSVGVIAAALQSSETTMAQANVAGLTVAPGDVIRMRVQVTGESPTTVRVKVWKDGTAEPAVWHTTGTNSTATLQDAGGVGAFASLSGTATVAPLTVSVDDFWAGPVGTP